MSPNHIAIIMDGNGRWAQSRGLPRSYGHRQGIQSALRAIHLAREWAIPYITLYTFSRENWDRPSDEVSSLIDLFYEYLQTEVDTLHKDGVRLKFIGQRRAFPSNLIHLINYAETLTQRNSQIIVTMALNYGARQEILEAIEKLRQNPEPRQITVKTFESCLETADLPNLDLLIRTGGEKRLSNFLLWQLAYSELIFIDTLWPDFDENAFKSALDEYQTRDRRYGRFI